MQVVRRDSDAGLARALDRARQAGPTWSDPLELPPPSGFRADELRRPLGSGPDVFDRAAERVLTWGVQKNSGLAVRSEQERAAVGVTFAVGLPFGPVWVVAPCRVVEVIESPSKVSMTFVTLRGHPECGIEEFAILRADDGNTSFAIRAISQPVSLPARLGRPVTRSIQVRQTRKYLDAAL